MSSAEANVVLRSLISDFSATVPHSIASQWKVFKTYEELQGGTSVEEFFLPPEIDNERVLVFLIKFTEKFVTDKIAHIHAPLF